LKLEKSVIQTIESGFFTKDLALQVKGEKIGREDWLNTEEFILKIAQVLKE
jgi:isocitrate dehydrogenase